MQHKRTLSILVIASWASHGSLGPRNGCFGLNVDLETQFADGRRLFSFQDPVDQHRWRDGMHMLAANARHQVSEELSGTPDQIGSSGILQSSQTVVVLGQVVAQTARISMRDFAKHARNIYGKFRPLKPSFAKRVGIQHLVENAEDVAKLAVILDDLLETATVLQSLTSSVQVALDNLANITAILRSVNTSAGLNRAFWTRMDFDTVATKIQIESIVIRKQSLSLTSSQASLHGYAKGNPMVSANVQSIANIIPAWLAMETAGISVCNLVFEGRNLAFSLKCRIESMIEALKEMRIINATTILAKCRGDLAQVADTLGEPCSTVPLSASIVVAPLSGSDSSIPGETLAVAAQIGVGIAMVCLFGVSLVLCRKVCKARSRDYSRADQDLEDSHMHMFGETDGEAEEARTYIQTMADIETWCQVDGYLSVNDVVRIDAVFPKCDLGNGLLGLVVHLDENGGVDVFFPSPSGGAVSHTRRITRQDFDKLSVIRTPESFS